MDATEFALKLGRYNNFSDQRIFEKFIANNGDIHINPDNDNILVELKKKRDLPQILHLLNNFDNCKYS